MQAKVLVVVALLGSMVSCTTIRSPEEPSGSRALQEVTSDNAGRQKGVTAQPLVAEAKVLEVESAARLAVEGQWLFQADRVQLTGYEYCSSAVRLLDQGELRLGIREASKALFLGQKSRDPDLLAYAYRDLAYAYSLAGDLEHAEQFANEAIKNARQSSQTNRDAVLRRAYKIRGDVYLRQERPSDALKDYQQALKVSDAAFEPFVLLSIANAAMASGNLPMAKQFFHKAENGAKNELRPLIRRGLGYEALAEGRYQDAVRLFTEASTQLTGLDQSYHQLWALDGVARAHKASGEYAEAVKAYRQAVTAAEKVRVKFRSEEFKTGFFGDIQRIFDEAITLLMETSQAEAAFDVSEQSRARALLDLVRGRVQMSAGPLAFSAPSGQPLSASQLRTMLSEGIVVVEYHVLPHRTYAWVVRSSGLSPIVLDTGKKSLEDLVQRFRTSIQKQEPQTLSLAADLYARLIQPLGLVGDETVIVVPHDVLHYLPFQALRSAEQYLIEERPILYAPSASVLLQLLTTAKNAKTQVLALGNPDLGTPRLALPGAQVEVERLQRIFPAAEVYIRQEATKERLMARASQSNLLHIAAHAKVDVVDPLYSEILLASTAQVPGTMEAHEVYRLNLAHTSLATLSACETGLGRVSRGDEVWGFTRAFLSAGAHALLVSLWPVHDEATARLMTRFYEELSKRPGPWALRTAQLDVLQDTQFRHPFYWAPFDLISDWR